MSATTAPRRVLAWLILLLPLGCTAADGIHNAPRKVEINSLRTTLPDWVRVQAHSIKLAALSELPDVDVGLRQVPLQTIGWTGIPEASAWTVDFTQRGAATPAVSYALSHWQRMGWKGPVKRGTRGGSDRPRVLAVNKYSVILGPTKGADQSPAGKQLTVRAAGLMDRLFSVAAATKKQQLGYFNFPVADIDEALIMPDEPVYQFMTYQLRFYLPTGLRPDTNAGQWSALASRRMLEVIRLMPVEDGTTPIVAVELYPPANVNRSRPNRYDPYANDPDQNVHTFHPDADTLTAAVGDRVRVERAIFERKLAKFYADSIQAALESGFAPNDRRMVYDRSLPGLEALVMSHPSHPGPASALGEKMFRAAENRLRRLLLSASFDCFETGHWPMTPLMYEPTLIDLLVALPAPTLVEFPRLIRAFESYRDLANAKPGLPPALFGAAMPSDPEVVLAEIGDRIRTVIARTPRGVVRKLFALTMPGVKVLRYPAYAFRVTDPLGNNIRSALSPVEIEIHIHRPGRPGAPLEGR